MNNQFWLVYPGIMNKCSITAMYITEITLKAVLNPLSHIQQIYTKRFWKYLGKYVKYSVNVSKLIVYSCKHCGNRIGRIARFEYCLLLSQCFQSILLRRIQKVSVCGQGLGCIKQSWGNLLCLFMDEIHELNDFSRGWVIFSEWSVNYKRFSASSYHLLFRISMLYHNWCILYKQNLLSFFTLMDVIDLCYLWSTVVNRKMTQNISRIVC